MDEWVDATTPGSRTETRDEHNYYQHSTHYVFCELIERFLNGQNAAAVGYECCRKIHAYLASAHWFCYHRNEQNLKKKTMFGRLCLCVSATNCC